MSFDWDNHFCLGCDRQTDGAVYCSESCRLEDYEKTSSSPSSGASSPTLLGQTSLWAATAPSPQRTSNVSPAYEFPSPLPRTGSHLVHQTRPSLVATRRLSTSNSHSSLCSVQSSTSTATDAPQLSDKTTRELRAYASSFELVRTQCQRPH